MQTPHASPSVGCGLRAPVTQASPALEGVQDLLTARPCLGSGRSRLCAGAGGGRLVEAPSENQAPCVAVVGHLRRGGKPSSPPGVRASRRPSLRPGPGARRPAPSPASQKARRVGFLAGGEEALGGSPVRARVAHRALRPAGRHVPTGLRRLEEDVVVGVAPDHLRRDAAPLPGEPAGRRGAVGPGRRFGRCPGWARGPASRVSPPRRRIAAKEAPSRRPCHEPGASSGGPRPGCRTPPQPARLARIPRRWKYTPSAPCDVERRDGGQPRARGALGSTPATPAAVTAGESTTGVHIHLLPNEPP